MQVILLLEPLSTFPQNADVFIRPQRLASEQPCAHLSPKAMVLQDGVEHGYLALPVSILSDYGTTDCLQCRFYICVLHVFFHHQRVCLAQVHVFGYV